MEIDPTIFRLASIFMPRAFEARAQIIKKNGRLVHYTRAEAALNMIRNQSVWMRKPQWMNDYRDVEHGLDCLVQAFRNSEGGQLFQKTIDKAFPGSIKNIIANFDSWVEHYRWNTYVACVSEHEDEEDINGRLSMWRAYGRDTGVALVVKSTPFTSTTDALGAYSSPVAYLTQAGVDAHLGNIGRLVEQDISFVQSQNQQMVEYFIHEAFRFGMLCTKHPGFAEEREWRIVYSPPRDQRKVLQKSIQTINGIPQPIYSIPLQKFDGYSIELKEILDRIIIGPTRFPSAIYEAFVAELEDKGVENASQKVIISEIPLRT